MLSTDLLEWHRLSRQQRSPLHLILFVTDHCNARCGTCFYWQSLNQGEALSLETLERISQGIERLVWLDISGGEPFLRKDIASICQTFVRRNGVRFINIPTNGIQTPVIVQLVAEILDSGNSFRLNVAVSLDGLGETHDRIRGVPGNYQKALATLAKLKELRAREPRLTLSLVTTLMRDNLEDVKQLMEMGRKEWQLDYHSLNILRGNPKDPELRPPTAEQYAEVSRLQLRHSRYYFEGRFGFLGGQLAVLGRAILNRYYQKELEGQPKLIQCNAGRVSCVIDANGDVYFCELLRKIGNLKDYDWDFHRLWYDHEARALRAEVDQGCHCTHECFHTKNLLLTPWRMV